MKRAFGYFLFCFFGMFTLSSIVDDGWMWISGKALTPATPVTRYILAIVLALVLTLMRPKRIRSTTSSAE